MNIVVLGLGLWMLCGILVILDGIKVYLDINNKITLEYAVEAILMAIIIFIFSPIILPSLILHKYKDVVLYERK